MQMHLNLPKVRMISAGNCLLKESDKPSEWGNGWTDNCPKALVFFVVQRFVHKKLQSIWEENLKPVMNCLLNVTMQIL